VTERYTYDEATLSLVCPVCRAAATAKCLARKSTGGVGWMEEPHAERFIAAHPSTQPPVRQIETITEVDIWGKPLK
jgi:hypothetical protein